MEDRKISIKDRVKDWIDSKRHKAKGTKAFEISNDQPLYPDKYYGGISRRRKRTHKIRRTKRTKRTKRMSVKRRSHKHRSHKRRSHKRRSHKPKH